ncbi:MAG TPA: polysaccharide biosynthesis/export family protein, partial [Candidatus Binataceae bacterium]|nr:polysaccharide biosynthesis/export family protein [Candidatus Binataceae bacterium]
MYPANKMNSPLNHLTKTISKPVRGAIGIRSLTILTVALGLFLAGCADTNPPLGQHTGATALQGKSCNPYCDTAPALTPSALKAVTEFRDAPQTQYQLGPGDSIGVTVWDHPELSGPRVVGPDGVIQVGLIGSVKVADLNADEAAKKLTAALSDDYVAPITS